MPEQVLQGKQDSQGNVGARPGEVGRGGWLFGNDAASTRLPQGAATLAGIAVPMAMRWHRWHNSVMMAQIIALLKSYGIGSRRSLHCDTMQEVLRGELERDVERSLSNNGCNGLASARNRRESAFRSWPSCKPATRVGGDDRHRSVRSGGGVGRFRA